VPDDVLIVTDPLEARLLAPEPAHAVRIGVVVPASGTLGMSGWRWPARSAAPSRTSTRRRTRAANARPASSCSSRPRSVAKVGKQCLGRATAYDGAHGRLRAAADDYLR
jgi:hypothetical protein